MKIYVETLGCPKNVVDSEVILGKLLSGRASLVQDSRLADAIIINTCGFIEDAQKESIEVILSAVELKRKGYCRHVLVTGCLSERYREQLRREIPEIDALWGARGIQKIAGEMQMFLGLDGSSVSQRNRFLTTPPSYGYLKIAEGCDNQCSFCAIPKIRGPHRSRPLDEIIQEAKQMVACGVKEIIVVSQDTTYYGQEKRNGLSLVKLLQELETIDDLKWIRLLYTYPERITDELIKTISESEKICPYLDMPIQHVADEILRRMRRGSRKEKLTSLIEKMRDTIPNLALRTSVIVGFPGETEEQFAELLEFVEQVQFERLGVFKFSAEEGTEAAEFQEQIDPHLKQERFDVLMELQEDIMQTKNSKLLGKKIDVLVDQVTPDGGVGRSCWDAPEIDLTIEVKGDVQVGDLVPVVMTQTSAYELKGDVIAGED